MLQTVELTTNAVAGLVVGILGGAAIRGGCAGVGDRCAMAAGCPTRFRTVQSTEIAATSNRYSTSRLTGVAPLGDGREADLPE